MQSAAAPGVKHARARGCDAGYTGGDSGTGPGRAVAVMKIPYWWILAAVLLAVGGCSGKSEPAKSQGGLDSVPDSNVFKGDVKALQKAQGVQQTIMDEDAKRRQTLDQTDQ